MMLVRDISFAHVSLKGVRYHMLIDRYLFRAMGALKTPGIAGRKNGTVFLKIHGIFRCVIKHLFAHRVTLVDVLCLHCFCSIVQVLCGILLHFQNHTCVLNVAYPLYRDMLTLPLFVNF